MAFRLPDITHRLTINGRTGSGKTVAGMWVLSESPFDKIPYVIVDYKRDALINGIDRAIEITYNDIPKKIGVYILHPRPGDDDLMEDWLSRVWEHGNIGLFFDEGYLVPATRRHAMFKTILTTGRSLHLPTTVISQRPAFVPRFVFSEADFYMSFHLNDKRDRDIVGFFTPSDDEVWNMENQLPNHYSRWYDIGKHASVVLKPVPKPELILQRFDERLRQRRKWY